MAKFNLPTATIIGIVSAILMTWFIAVKRSEHSDSFIYIYSVIVGIICFVVGGFIGGSFESYKYIAYTPCDNEKKKKQLTYNRY